METKQTYHELLENAPDFAEATADLFSWSENHDHGRKPSQLFLDMIGWSDDVLGTKLFDYENVGLALGYLELDMLADALKEYASRPQDVYRYVEQVLEAEMEGDEVTA